MKIANTTAGGRLISVLEGGYKVQGGPVSALGRSVASHIRALSGGFSDLWDTSAEQAALKKELGWLHAQDVSARAEASSRSEASASAHTFHVLLETDPTKAELGSSSLQKKELEGPQGVVPSEESLGEAGVVSSRTKRRRAEPVDYVALDAKLREDGRQG